MKFKHLQENDQNYSQHFNDAFRYSFESLKCSFYFLCHAFWPDIYKKNGSNKINKLSEEIKEKYKKINEKHDI